MKMQLYWTTNVTENQIDKIDTGNEQLNLTHDPQLTGVKIDGLLTVAAQVVGYGSHLPAPSIHLFSVGAFHKVYLISFPSGTPAEVIARIPWPQSANEGRMRSAVATMHFLYMERPALPVPRLYASAFNRQNPVGVPYILMERACGRPLTPTEWENRFTQAQKDRVAEEFTRILLELSRPVNLPGVGSIQFAGQSERASSMTLYSPKDGTSKLSYKLGPLYASQDMRVPHTPFPQPSDPKAYASLATFWRAVLELEMRAAMERWNGDRARVIYKDELCFQYTRTLSDFYDCHGYLQRLTVACERKYGDALIAPAGILHPDLSVYRNVLFDERGEQITAVFDWDDAAVLPLPLLAQYPQEFCLYGDPLRPRDVWKPEEWSKDPEDRKLAEHAVEATRLRYYFQNVMARADASFQSSFWTDAELPLRVHDAIVGGWKVWMSQLDEISTLVKDHCRD